MGRAGAGGYATVQHAYDTRLKRDVAIKCIQITPDDIARSRISIHDAQVANASMPLVSLRTGRDGRHSAQDDQGGGFVPLTSKINEPTFIAKNAERREKRRGFLNRDARSRADRNKPSDTEDFEGEAPEYADYHDGADSFDLSDFSAYSNFKGSAGGRRREVVADSSNTFGFSKFANNIPGKISGAGEVENISVDDAINVQLPTIDESRTRPIQARGARRGADNGAKRGAGSGTRQDAGSGAPNASGGNGADEAAAREGMSMALPIRRDERRQLAKNQNVQQQAAFDPYNPALDNFPGLEEARTAAHLNDPNIVTVYDCVVEGNMAYVIMEYVEGKTLARILREIGNDITLDMISSVFKSVSHALEVAHKANVLHLDIKPENVIVNNEGVVKVTDFGLSTLMDASGQGETGGGTIGYMPLEQMRQERLDVRTDEWALASLTYEMLSGKNPFKARSLGEAEVAIEDAELIIPSLCWEDISESVDDIMFDALSPDMDGRYPTIKRFADDLSPFLGDAKEGKEQLAAVVKGDETTVHEERAPEPTRPSVPLIDRLGARGSNIFMRVFSGLGAVMLALLALINFRIGAGEGTDTVFGLFSIMPIAAWVALAVIVAVAVIWPRFGMPLSYLAFVVMLFFNQAWLPGFLMLAGTGAWWWLFGRDNNLMCGLAMMQPLFGSVGFTPIVAILSGALLDVRDAILTVAMSVLSAIIFASLGSHDVMNWAVYTNYIVAVNPSIAGAEISSGFVETITQPQNWIMIASWFIAAALYSLMCRRGTRVFDILASIVAAAFVVAGAILLPLLTSNMEMLTPLLLGGTIASALFGIVLALLNVPDRVRLAPGEW